MSHIEIILGGSLEHPHCPHGPSILFSRVSNGNRHNFYACSASRDRKLCPFYLNEEELSKVSDIKKKQWKEDKLNFIKGINHRKLFIELNNVQQLHKEQREYCHTCNQFVFENYKSKHKDHKLRNNLDDYMLSHPSELLEPLHNPRKEAQFLFSKVAIKTIMGIIRSLNFEYILCMGVPRIHEHIINEYPHLNSLLLDIDRRYHAFFSPLQFCWYNMFNNYFFLEDSKGVFNDFIQSCKGKDLLLITDPPFGGRVELIAHTIKTINQLYKTLNNIKKDMRVFLIFPYFMERQILNRLPDYSMLDYKVDYDNHPLFQDGPKGRKQGSPVRLFTNVDASCITLPADEGYKLCTLCNRWVAEENCHCIKCNACTSKDGRTYVHCNQCEKCVKPTWVHCNVCKRCAQPDHKCGELTFSQECFHCKELGHKKRNCPKVNQEELHRKRSNKIEVEKSKKLRKE